MPEVFVDSFFWIASLLPRDQWHEQALAAKENLASDIALVTTREVLTEFLAATSRNAPTVRQAAVKTVRAILEDEAVIVIPQSPALFSRGLDFYEQRLDKRFSLPDCISMIVMRERGIQEILTRDRDYCSGRIRCTDTLNEFTSPRPTPCNSRSPSTASAISSHTSMSPVSSSSSICATISDSAIYRLPPISLRRANTPRVMCSSDVGSVPNLCRIRSSRTA